MLVLKNISKQDRWLALSVIFSLLIFGTLACTVAVPAYKSPVSRSYNSKFGYSALTRKQDKAFPVDLEKAEVHKLTEIHLGEGLMASQPVLVPVIPISKVKKLYVEEGEYVEKGQLLLEMDPKFASIKLSSAELAVQTASSELGRVAIGSAYILAQERPEKDKLDYSLAQKEVNLLSSKLQRYKKLLKQGAISKDEYLELELRLSEAVKQLDSSKFYLGMSTKGQRQSLSIAKNSVSEAKNNLKHKSYEIEHYRVFAPAAGIIERVLIREGEYNQDSGRPAFVIASGLWFEAHLDQTAISSVKEGDKAKVYLEAFAGKTLEGEVKRIKRVVSYNAGGPEISRPIRPRGSSTPEWPSTFVVRVYINQSSGVNLYPGLTGFAKIVTEKEVLSVSRAALTSFSTNTALIKIPTDGSFVLRSIETGLSSRERVEVVSGLRVGEEIISSGHQVLEMGDKVELLN